MAEVVHSRPDGRRRLTGTPRLLAPPLAVLGIVVLDVIDARYWPLPVHGALDEAGHQLTAALALAALLPAGSRLWPWALLGAFVIDLDHVPLYLWNGLATIPNGRPVTHSLLTVAVLLAVAAVLSRGPAAAFPRARRAVLGVALGVLLHFLRDVATSSGLQLAWPLTTAHVRAPYPLYLAAVVALAAVAVARMRRRIPGHLPARPPAEGRTPR